MSNLKEFMLGMLFMTLIVCVLSVSTGKEEAEAFSSQYEQMVCMYHKTDGEAGWPDYDDRGITKEYCKELTKQ